MSSRYARPGRLPRGRLTSLNGCATTSQPSARSRSGRAFVSAWMIARAKVAGSYAAGGGRSFYGSDKGGRHVPKIPRFRPPFSCFGKGCFGTSDDWEEGSPRLVVLSQFGNTGRASRNRFHTPHPTRNRGIGFVWCKLKADPTVAPLQSGRNSFFHQELQLRLKAGPRCGVGFVSSNQPAPLKTACK